MRKALISGITGQDGSYLTELLLQQGYQVIGMVHPPTTITYEYIRPFEKDITLVNGDLMDQPLLEKILTEHEPDEVYNLAAMSFPPASWDSPLMTGETTALGVTRLLEAIRKTNPKTRFYQASSSELFGLAVESPQKETTAFHPRNPYGVSKLYAHWITINYREHHGLYAVSGIMFNHESPRRGLEYVTRKITHSAANIKKGLLDKLSLGNLDARRDWGYAGDYVRAMWMMLQQETAHDYVIGSGETHSVRELCEIAFGHVNLDYHDYVTVDPHFYRPPEEVLLVADPTRAHSQLGWVPSMSFKDMICLMVDSDLQIISS
jgi:GDPmannose 4,6-dehydratase